MNSETSQTQSLITIKFFEEKIEASTSTLVMVPVLWRIVSAISSCLLIIFARCMFYVQLFSRIKLPRPSHLGRADRRKHNHLSQLNFLKKKLKLRLQLLSWCRYYGELFLQYPLASLSSLQGVCFTCNYFHASSCLVRVISDGLILGRALVGPELSV